MLQSKVSLRIIALIWTTLSLFVCSSAADPCAREGVLRPIFVRRDFLSKYTDRPTLKVQFETCLSRIKLVSATRKSRSGSYSTCFFLSRKTLQAWLKVSKRYLSEIANFSFCKISKKNFKCSFEALRWLEYFYLCVGARTLQKSGTQSLSSKVKIKKYFWQKPNLACEIKMSFI